MNYYSIGYIFVNVLLFCYILGAWISCIRYYAKGNCFRPPLENQMTLNLYSITDLPPVNLLCSSIVLFFFGQAAAFAWIITVPVGILIMVARYYHTKNRRVLDAVDALNGNT